MYKGEQHGFRSAAAIRSSLEGEMYFYGKVGGAEGGAYVGDVCIRCETGRQQGALLWAAAAGDGWMQRYRLRRCCLNGHIYPLRLIGTLYPHIRRCWASTPRTRQTYSPSPSTTCPRPARWRRSKQPTPSSVHSRAQPATRHSPLHRLGFDYAFATCYSQASITAPRVVSQPLLETRLEMIWLSAI